MSLVNSESEDFYVEDEPVDQVVAAFEAGEKRRTAPALVLSDREREVLAVLSDHERELLASLDEVEVRRLLALLLARLDERDRAAILHEAS